MNPYDDLIAEIELAFPATALPQDEPWVIRATEDFESGRFRDLLRGVRTWKNLTLGRFRALYSGDPSVTLFLMTAPAAKCLLPAYLLICLRQFREADMICPSLISFLSPQRGNDQGILGLAEFADALTSSQVRAIVHFLEYIDKAQASAFPDRAPRIALSDFWLPYLATVESR